MAENPKQVDIYDEEFFTNLELAKNLISQLPRANDKDICKKWINRLLNLKTNDPVVKKNRNAFFKYMIQIIHKGVMDQPEAHLGFPQYDDQFESPTGEGDSPKGEQVKDFMSRWSPDKRTYIAAKPLPGRGALVYMAVSRNPTLGWDNPKVV